MGVLSDAAVPQGDFYRSQAEMGRDVAANRTARALEASSIGAGGLRVNGGDITIDDGGNLVIRGGEFELIDPAGETIVFLGTLSNGATGFIFRYDSGATLFSRQGVQGQQLFGLWDPSGNIIFSNDANSGFGIGRPWLPLTMPQPTGVSHWQSTTSGTFAAIGRSIAVVQQPRMRAQFRAFAEAGTTGEVRMTVHGQQMGDVTTVSDGAFETGGFDEAIPEGLDFSDNVTVEIQARVTAGGGSVSAAMEAFYGTQS